VGAIKKLLFLFAVFFAFPLSALAEDYAAIQGYLHSFNNGVSVYSGVFSLNKDVSLNTTISLKYAIDLINPDGEDGDDDDDDDDEDVSGSLSSVAAVSVASSAVNAGSDTRHAFTAGVAHNFDNVIAVEAYYDYSHEKDYSSSTPTLTLKKELFEKNTTLTAGYSRNSDTIEGIFMPNEEDRTTDNFFFGLTQVLSPVTVAQVGYSHSKATGHLSEGIRLVAVDGTDAATCTDLTVAGCAAEVFPSERKRNAYLVGVNHYFTEGLGGLIERSAVKLTFRYYDDSWDVNSWMGEAEFYKYLDEDLIMRLNYRYYTQSAAFFVKDAYASGDLFKSSSPQIEEKDTNLFGLKLIYLLDSPANVWKLAVNSLEGKYEYYTESIGVDAHILMGGLRFSF
jgi:hypothetical protein